MQLFAFCSSLTSEMLLRAVNEWNLKREQIQQSEFQASVRSVSSHIFHRNYFFHTKSNPISNETQLNHSRNHSHSLFPILLMKNSMESLFFLQTKREAFSAKSKTNSYCARLLQEFIQNRIKILIIKSINIRNNSAGPRWRWRPIHHITHERGAFRRLGKC